MCRDGAHKDRNLNRKNSRNALRGRGKDLWRPKCSFVYITFIHRNSECREVVIASPNRSIKLLYLMSKDCHYGRYFHVLNFGRITLTVFSARQARRACVDGAV